MTLVMAAGLGGMPSGDALKGIPTVNPKAAEGRQPELSLAALWQNLLPDSSNFSKQDTKHGVYVEEALPPMPHKLADRICRWEYIDMSELLPEFWQKAEEKESGQRPSGNRRKRPVTSLNA